MRKLRMDVDALKVESFVTGGEDSNGRTVKGHDSTTDCGATDSGDAYCAENTQFCPANTDKYTCAAGCEATWPPQATCNTQADSCPCTRATYCTACPNNTCYNTCWSCPVTCGL